MDENAGKYVSHNTFSFSDGDVLFSSDFDNGNLARVERSATNSNEFKIWTAPDNMGTSYQSKTGFWFYFSVSGLKAGSTLKIQIANPSNHANLYKHDMRPVFKVGASTQRWQRVRSSVRFVRDGDGQGPQLYFDHTIESEDIIYFAFTYPYTCAMLENDLRVFDTHSNELNNPSGIYASRECVTYSCDGRRIEFLTITSNAGVSANEQREPVLTGLFPNASQDKGLEVVEQRPLEFPSKEVIFISARVHPGEVPASHTFKGILTFLLDQHDRIAKALRDKYVFKMIPILNPDGVYRGHSRMDQFGENLNRYYVNAQPSHHPSIFAAKSLIDFYAGQGKLSMYLDCHAHASKRGCFIYGNVMDALEDQVQNQLLCRLIAMNTPHFDYEGCLFSKEHMSRIDPGDMDKGLTAEGSGRVNTYLAHGVIHSYTLECNYNTGKTGNEVAPTEAEHGGQHTSPASTYTPNPERYTPHSWASVGRACVVAILDLRNHNPCSRIPKSKIKSLERIKQIVEGEVRSRKEFKAAGAPSVGRRHSGASVKDIRRGMAPLGRNSSHSNGNPNKKGGSFRASAAWKRTVFEGLSKEASTCRMAALQSELATQQSAQAQAQSDEKKIGARQLGDSDEEADFDDDDGNDRCDGDDNIKNKAKSKSRRSSTTKESTNASAKGTRSGTGDTTTTPKVQRGHSESFVSDSRRRGRGRLVSADAENSNNAPSALVGSQSGRSSHLTSKKHADSSNTLVHRNPDDKERGRTTSDDTLRAAKETSTRASSGHKEENAVEKVNSNTASVSVSAKARSYRANNRSGVRVNASHAVRSSSGSGSGSGSRVNPNPSSGSGSGSRVNPNPSSGSGSGSGPSSSTRASSAVSDSMSYRDSMDLTDDDVINLKENVLIMNAHAHAHAHTHAKKGRIVSGTSSQQGAVGALKPDSEHTRARMSALFNAQMANGATKAATSLLPRRRSSSDGHTGSSSGPVLEDPNSFHQRAIHGYLSKSPRSAKREFLLKDEEILADINNIAAARNHDAVNPATGPVHGHRAAPSQKLASSPSKASKTTAQGRHVRDDNGNLSQYLPRRTLSNAGMQALDSHRSSSGSYTDKTAGDSCSSEPMQGPEGAGGVGGAAGVARHHHRSVVQPTSYNYQLLSTNSLRLGGDGSGSGNGSGSLNPSPSPNMKYRGLFPVTYPGAAVRS